MPHALAARLRLAAPLGRVLPLLALLACGLLLLRQLAQGDLALTLVQTGAALAHIAPGQWLLAVAFCGLSFLAIGRFDGLAHRVIGTGVAPRRARQAGVRAIAVAQAVGFGGLSAGLVRMRLLPELDLWPLGRLSALVSLSFLAAWALLTAGVVLWLRGDLVQLAIVTALAAVVISQMGPLRGMPGLRPGAGIAALAWTMADTAAAALLLGTLLPADSAVPLGSLLAAYLLAHGAGLLSQSPGGLGAFELTLLALLPAVPQPDLLAAILGYRLVYHLVPAALALLTLLRPSLLPAPIALTTAQGAARDRALARAPRSDWALAHQGAQIVVTRDQGAGWLLRQAHGHLVALGQPLGQPQVDDLDSLAKTRGLRPLLYKCDARTASRARAAGWSVLRIAADALIDPSTWTDARPACRQLRRKLRAAQAAGLTIQCDPIDLPLRSMATVSLIWEAGNGGERGFSMGRFDPDHLARQVVLLGYAGPRLVGFVTFHRAGTDWTLDLVRLVPDAPDGTIQSLICAAIAAAREAAVPLVSLAAVAAPAPGPAGIFSRLIARHRQTAGLRQFKQSFGPFWQPLYLCAPGRFGLVAGLCAVMAAIHLPQRGPARGAASDPSTLPAGQLPPRADLRQVAGKPAAGLAPPAACPTAQGRTAQIRFESSGRPCDATGNERPRMPFLSPGKIYPRTGLQNDKRPFPPP